jgi:hypothetical protein
VRRTVLAPGGASNVTGSFCERALSRTMRWSAARSRSGTSSRTALRPRVHRGVKFNRSPIRRVPADLLGGLEKDEPARGFIIGQDREIAEKSSRPPPGIKRSPAPAPRRSSYSRLYSNV